MSKTTWRYLGTEDVHSYAETDDPRVIALIALDFDAQAPWGDALAPAYWTDYRGWHGWSAERAGEVYHGGNSDEVADAYVRARDYFGDYDKAERFLKIFYGVTDVRTVTSTVYQGGREILIFETPDYLEHIGATEPGSLDGDVAEWRAYLDGEVYGIGCAINPDRVDFTDDVDLADFDVTYECWGFYGEDYAKQSALEEFLPVLDQPLLPLEVTA